MKKLDAVVVELREQIEEATDPKDPKKLTEYTSSLLDGIGSVVPMLLEDPTMAALAFHGQIKFAEGSALGQLAERKNLSGGDWLTVKPSIQVRPAAHDAVRVLEEAGLEVVLAIAMVANFKLKKLRRAQHEAEEEEEEFQNVQ